MFRMVAGPGEEVYVELDSRLPGRGAYCCVERKCLESALEAKLLARAFRKYIQAPKADEISANLRRLLGERVEGLLGAAWRKKAVAAGRDSAQRALRSAPGGRLFLASDLSEGSRAELLKRGLESHAEMYMTMEQIGAVLGGRPVGVVFVSDPSLADSIALRCAQAGALGAG
jgi:predicted RNA-binding protein YlxR (DUF448 family)